MPSSRIARVHSPRTLLTHLSVWALAATSTSLAAVGCKDEEPEAAQPTEAEAEHGCAAEVGALDYDPRQSVAPLVEAVSPAVASIVVEGKPVGGVLFGQPAEASGRGSGFVMRADGIVVTNHHVVDGAKRIRVAIGERSYDAKVLGSDPATDLAVLQLEGAENLPTVSLGRSSELKVGDWMVAIGNPLGLEHSASIGILSGRGRGSLGLYRDSYIDFLQTDAYIAPGSSGGPLFDLRGHVVGITTAVAAMQGPGFAIPIDQAKAIISQLQDHGKVVRGWLGASSRVGAADEELDEQDGALIGEVLDDSPAASAGLRAGDRVTKLDGQTIEDFTALRTKVAELAPGHTALLEVVRDGQTMELTVVLGERPQSEELDAVRPAVPMFPAPFDPRSPFGAPNPFDFPDASRPDSSRPSPFGAPPDAPSSGPRLGVQARPHPDGLEVVGVEPGSIAADLELRAGDVVTTVNGKRISSPEDVRSALEASSKKIEIEFMRGNVKHEASLERS